MEWFRRVVYYSVVGVLLIAFMAGCATQPTDTSTGNKTPEVVEFSAEPTLVERNGQVTLRWAVHNVETVTIEQRHGSYKQAADYMYVDLPAEGTLTIDLNQSPVPYIDAVSFSLLIRGETTSPWTPGYTFLKAVGIQVRCPFDGFFFGIDLYYRFCPLTEAQKVEAVYQPFEDGFLLWRSDNNLIYVFRSCGDQMLSCTALRFQITSESVEAVPSAAPSQIPKSRFAPAPMFSRFLSANARHGIIIGLGLATTAETTYEATVQDSYNDTFYDAVSYISLPDNRVIRYLEDIYASAWMCINC